MHPKLHDATRRLQHAQLLAEDFRSHAEERFGPDTPYQVLFIRLGNKAKYAQEIIECYAHRMSTGGPLPNDQIERIVETEKWFLIGVLSVIEYSVPSILSGRGSKDLRQLATHGPFSQFLSRAAIEKVIDQNVKGLFEFLMRLRNDLIHRNGVSKESATLLYESHEFRLVEGKMIEAAWGALADLGTLAIAAVTYIIDDIEQYLGSLNGTNLA